MAVEDQNALALFRFHCTLAQLQFAEANPDMLKLPDEDIRAMALHGSKSLGLLTHDDDAEVRAMTSEELTRRLLERTERSFPRLVPVAELAQAATIRLLYRGTAIEDSDPTEVMSLELTAKLAAQKLGIRDETFMSWHRLQFADDANPQVVMQRLEQIISEALRAARIFLSYRRDDTELFVGRVCDRLEDAGYDVVYDVDKLVAGETWRDRLRHYVSISNILIAVIGRHWVSERLFDCSDPVRIEIALALHLGKPVLPLLVNRAGMPTNDQLPPDLKRMRELHAAELEPGASFNQQMTRLLDSLRRLTEGG